MMNYRVLVLCDYCGRVHQTGITLDLDDDLGNKQTVAKAFKDKRIPPVITKIQSERITDIVCEHPLGNQHGL